MGEHRWETCADSARKSQAGTHHFTTASPRMLNVCFGAVIGRAAGAELEAPPLEIDAGSSADAVLSYRVGGEVHRVVLSGGLVLHVLGYSLRGKLEVGDLP